MLLMRGEARPILLSNTFVKLEIDGTEDVSNFDGGDVIVILVVCTEVQVDRPSGKEGIAVDRHLVDWGMCCW